MTLAGPVALALVLASCGADDGGREVRGRAPLSAPDPDAVAPTVRSVNQFATDLYRAYGSAERGNFSFSPYVIAYTLGMVRAGSATTTRQEIDHVLGDDGSFDLDRGFATLAQTLAERNGDRRSDSNKGRIDIMAPSALWGSRGTRFNEPFLDTLAADYDTGVRVVDLRPDADAARATINTWARDATDGTVTQLLPRGVVTDQTSLIDASAFSLQAPWATPFTPSKSAAASFTPDGGTTLSTRSIGGTVASGARFADGTGWQALELPYAGGQLAMLLIVPDAGTFDQFEAGFDGERLRSITGSLHATAVDVQLPRFQFQTDARLDPALERMGVTTVFDENHSDLSGMSPDGPLTLSSVSHQAYLDVNQNGTGTQAGSISVAPPDQVPPVSAVRVTIDRPFLVLVRDIPTDVVLSIGRVVTPN